MVAQKLEHRVKDFIGDLKRKFNPLARQKELEFTIETSEAPDQWTSDSQKLDVTVLLEHSM